MLLEDANLNQCFSSKKRIKNNNRNLTTTNKQIKWTDKIEQSQVPVQLFCVVLNTIIKVISLAF